MLTEKQTTEFEWLARPIVKWLNDDTNPHTEVIIDCDSARVVQGLCTIPIPEYIKD